MNEDNRCSYMAFLVACELTNDEACDDAEGFGAGGLNIFLLASFLDARKSLSFSLWMCFL